LSYIRILGSLSYITVNNRDNKLANKANNSIIVDFKSSISYLIYVPNTGQIVDSRNVIIKEDINYSNNYTIIEDYKDLLEQSSTDCDVLKPLINTREDSSTNNESRDNYTSPSNSTASSNTSSPVIRPNTSNIQDEEVDESLELDELSIDYYNLSTIPSSNDLSLYNLASIAYIGLLNEGMDKDSSNSTVFRELNSYKEAIHSIYKDQ
jgi:hypothetical protein